MKGTGQVVSGKLYLDTKIMDYIRKNEGLECEVDIVILNKPEHYLYRYLCGFLEKDIAFHSGLSRDEVSDMMKEKFATENVETWDDVPRRHRAKCQRYERLYENGTVERWYVKSRSSMTHEELMEYVSNVENHFFDFMEGAIQKKHEKEAYEMRKVGMMNGKEFKKYLEKKNEKQV